MLGVPVDGVKLRNLVRVYRKPARAPLVYLVVVVVSVRQVHLTMLSLVSEGIDGRLSCKHGIGTIGVEGIPQEHVLHGIVSLKSLLFWCSKEIHSMDCSSLTGIKKADKMQNQVTEITRKPTVTEENQENISSEPETTNLFDLKWSDSSEHILIVDGLLKFPDTSNLESSGAKRLFWPDMDITFKTCSNCTAIIKFGVIN